MPSSPSARLGLVDPLDGEAAEDYPAVSAANTAALESKLLVMYDAGARSSRPRSNTGANPGIAGRTYRSPDGGVDLDLGTSWMTVTPGLFTALPAVSGHTSDGLDTGMRILYQTAAMVTAGVPPIDLRYTGAAWQEIAGGASRGLVGAYLANTTSIVTGATIQLDAKEFDPSGWFNTAAGLYTPQVAGYYRISWMLNGVLPIGTGYFQSGLAKNGSLFKAGPFLWFDDGGGAGCGGTAVVVANGSTDAFGVRIAQATANPMTILSGASQTYMHCEMIAAS